MTEVSANTSLIHTRTRNIYTFVNKGTWDGPQVHLSFSAPLILNYRSRRWQSQKIVFPLDMCECVYVCLLDTKIHKILAWNTFTVSTHISSNHTNCIRVSRSHRIKRDRCTLRKREIDIESYRRDARTISNDSHLFLMPTWKRISIIYTRFVGIYVNAGFAATNSWKIFETNAGRTRIDVLRYKSN